MAHNGDGVHAVIYRIARTALYQPIDIDGVQSRGALFKRLQTGEFERCRGAAGYLESSGKHSIGWLAGGGGGFFPVTLGRKRIAWRGDTLPIACEKSGPR